MTVGDHDGRVAVAHLEKVGAVGALPEPFPGPLGALNQHPLPILLLVMADHYGVLPPLQLGTDHFRLLMEGRNDLFTHPSFGGNFPLPSHVHQLQSIQRAHVVHHLFALLINV
ncbi:protein of unknown function (plasmid) [Azospirillum baldaniorum]|uniref:Uncharacterized protein n=1 Tax=Azospirillum baldaniorum TaxID=1064539 RepID=A0A9P1K1J0_9PROT|nr:protein of unknown function [Azospirillum baldaniorum]